MNNYSKLYWLTRLDGLDSLATTVIIFSLIAIVYYIAFILSIGCDEDMEEVKKYKGFRNTALYLLVFFSAVSIFVPTKKEALFIIAGSETLDYIQKDENIQKIPEKSSELIIKYLDDKLQELDKREAK